MQESEEMFFNLFTVFMYFKLEFHIRSVNKETVDATTKNPNIKNIGNKRL